MRSRRNVLLSIRKTRIRRRVGTQFDQVAAPVWIKIDGPRHAPSVIKNFRASGINLIGQAAHGGSLMALGNKIQTIANRTLGESLEKTPRQRRGDYRRQIPVRISQYETGRSKTSERINIGQ